MLRILSALGSEIILDVERGRTEDKGVGLHLPARVRALTPPSLAPFKAWKRRSRAMGLINCGALPRPVVDHVRQNLETVDFFPVLIRAFGPILGLMAFNYSGSAWSVGT